MLEWFSYISIHATVKQIILKT